MEYFKWNDTYKLNNDQVDNQHQKLFTIANELFSTPLGDKTNALIMELYKYTRYHFSSEEELMKENNFPLLEEHKKLHGKLIDQLNILSENGISSEDEFTELKLFVWNWLKNHVMIEDNKYRDYI